MHHIKVRVNKNDCHEDAGQEGEGEGGGEEEGGGGEGDGEGECVGFSASPKGKCEHDSVEQNSPSEETAFEQLPRLRQQLHVHGG